MVREGLVLGWKGRGEKWVRTAMVLEKAASAKEILGEAKAVRPTVHRIPQILSHGFHYSTSLLKP